MLLFVGLGNPGPKYDGTRHNAGFMVLDRFCSDHGLLPLKEKFKGQFTRGTVRGQEVVCLLPQTYMNLSGESVQAAMKFFKVELRDVLVIHDELDLPFGTTRLKFDGGLAGHNGLRSITKCCGGQAFGRLRVGIGRPRSGSVEGHVLSLFSSEERAELADVLQRASAGLEDVLDHGFAAAMNRHNSVK